MSFSLITDFLELEDGRKTVYFSLIEQEFLLEEFNATLTSRANMFVNIVFPLLETIMEKRNLTVLEKTLRTFFLRYLSPKKGLFHYPPSAN